MKKQNIINLITGCVLACASTAVLADDMPANSMNMSNILSNLKNEGFVAVHEIKFDDKVFKAEVINSAGNEVDVRIDPLTGKILDPKSEENKMSMMDAAKKVEAAGFHNIYSMESEDHGFEIKAMDKDGKKTEIKIDAAGNMTSKTK